MIDAVRNEMEELFGVLDKIIEKVEDWKPGDVTVKDIADRYNISAVTAFDRMIDLCKRGIVRKVLVKRGRARLWVYRAVDKGDKNETVQII